MVLENWIHVEYIIIREAQLFTTIVLTYLDLTEPL